MEKTISGYAARSADTPVTPFRFDRRAPRADDVVIDILFCGVCHTDIHQTRNEWGNAAYPMVPGHEIIGRVSAVGDAVTRFTPGEVVGVGTIVDSCRRCEACLAGEEVYCEEWPTVTYKWRRPPRRLADLRGVLGADRGVAGLRAAPA